MTIYEGEYFAEFKFLQRLPVTNRRHSRLPVCATMQLTLAGL
jgi:hypothetical protein